MDLLASYYCQQGGGGCGGGGVGSGGACAGGGVAHDVGGVVVIVRNFPNVINTNVPNLSCPHRAGSTSVPTHQIGTHLTLITTVPILAQVVPDVVDAGVAAVVALHEAQPLAQVGEEVGKPYVSYISAD